LEKGSIEIKAETKTKQCLWNEMRVYVIPEDHRENSTATILGVKGNT
jgi:hypothetical protein